MIVRMNRIDIVRRTRPAFTLMEMLIVVAIIVILASLGGYYVIGQYNEAKVSEAKVKARTISKAVDTYYIDHGEWPTDLTLLLQKSELGKGPYLTNQNEIIDPWGKQYQYDQNGQKNIEYGSVIAIPDVFTTTPDGRMVGNWSDTKK
ncbi:MAG: type II secretion system protein GspG [Gemmataceae bacterium]|nr:type II secretion system protein GspG [Gemmataceae bacterium]